MCIRDRGNTSGWGFGAMYELTYDVYLNEDRSSILQPLANASVVTLSLIHICLNQLHITYARYENSITNHRYPPHD